MERRIFHRYGSELLLESLTSVLLVLPDKQVVESCIVDISAQGLKVSIPPSSGTLSVPRKNETVEIIFSAIQLTLTCRCIYSMYNQDGSIHMGLYVFDPDNQSKLSIILNTIE